MSGKFEGKNVLVTGANSGLGLAAAQYFVAEGALVFATGRRQDQLDRAIELIGKNVVGVQGDITKVADLERLFATIKGRVDKLDVVVANAGAAIFATIGQYTHEILDETLGLNLKGTAFTVQGALPLMPNGATIVLVSSIEGLRGSPGLGIYAATKAALRSFARTWAAELRDRSIRVNAISPGVVFTPAYETAGVTLESLDPLLPTIPLGRLGTPQEIAKAIGFLASDDSSYLTATDLIVDGGLIDVSSGIKG